MDREKVISEFEDFVKSFSKRDDTYYKGLFVSVLDLLKEQECTGSWEDNGNGTISCSECGTWFPKEREPYLCWCGWCGAKMKGR